jgi:hypothetical protein
LYAACLQAPKAYSDFWALLRQSQLATISERDPWIVEQVFLIRFDCSFCYMFYILFSCFQCERVLTEDFGDWPIGPDSETVDVDSGDGDQSEKKTHIKADAKKSDKKSDKRVHDNNSLATVKTVISYLDVCRGLETVPLEGDAIFYMTVPLLRVMQVSFANHSSLAYFHISATCFYFFSLRLSIHLLHWTR